jgi:hypothetical protein
MTPAFFCSLDSVIKQLSATSTSSSSDRSQRSSFDSAQQHGAMVWSVPVGAAAGAAGNTLVQMLLRAVVRQHAGAGVAAAKQASWIALQLLRACDVVSDISS